MRRVYSGKDKETERFPRAYHFLKRGVSYWKVRFGDWFFNMDEGRLYVREKYTSHRLLEYPKRKGETEFFGNGTFYFEKLFSDISHAKSTIHLSFYRVKHDSSGKQFLHLLKQKSQEGVKVRLLLDLFGSLRFPQGAVKDLKENGIEFAYSHKPSLTFWKSGSKWTEI